MADEKAKVPVEIAHVLFLDVVGYSKRLIDEQSELLQTLKTIVQETASVRSAKGKRDLIRLPTGDGMALVFRGKPEAPMHCALEISRALQEHSELGVRMGIHSGPIHEVRDVNERANVAGAGIDLAQRVMDCGDRGHILLSKRVADDLAPYPRWHASLHDLGECEVKHGVRVHLFNFYTDEVGNPEIPSKLGKRGRQAPGKTFNLSWGAACVALVLCSLGAAVFWFAAKNNGPPPKPRGVETMAPIPQKSIAVLPFENLSEEKKNAYFAEGIQDEILTDLAKIADLKVISRTSVMQYRSGTARNLREIGKQLGVAHLLEGSVQSAEGKVRVNAQLIDAQTDAHLWAQTYDRNLSDVFAIQSDIANAIAQELQAKLAPEEKSRLALKPTANPDAYLLYLQANQLVHVGSSRLDAVNADKVYAQAIALDPKFALACARDSMLNSLMYFIGRDPARATKARALANQALQLSPDLGEAHLALGLCYYRIDADYDKALHELSIAAAASPNSAEILDFSGFVNRRKGQWREALAIFARAQELDPQAADVDGLPDTLRALRLWTRSAAAYDRALEIDPQLPDGWIGLAYVQFAQSGNPSTAGETLSRLPATLQKVADVKDARWTYAMLARDFATAEKVIPDPPWDELPAIEPKPFYEASTALAEGHPERARDFLEKIRALHETLVRDHPADPKFHASLGRVYAMMGRKDDALREARRATELCPEGKDAVDAPLYLTNLAFVYAQAGEKDQAINLLTQLLSAPAAEGITLAHLRLSWEWDPLRADSRFQKILDSPEPATIYR